MKKILVISLVVMSAFGLFLGLSQSGSGGGSGC